MSKFERFCPARFTGVPDGHDQPAGRIDIDEAAVHLIRQFGDDSAAVAYSRSYCCRCRGNEDAARQWNAVVKRIVDLLYAKREGPLH